jgi:hypothetical protein
MQDELIVMAQARDTPIRSSRGPVRWFRFAVAMLGVSTLLACDETAVGVPRDVLVGVASIEVSAIRDGRLCSLGTIEAVAARREITEILVHLPEWPKVSECGTPFCNEIRAAWRTGTLISGEVGVCEDRVTVHVPGPQGCGRVPPPEQLQALRRVLEGGTLKIEEP